MSSVEIFSNTIPSQTKLSDGKIFRQLEDRVQNLREDELEQLDSELAESALATYNSVLTVKLAKSKYALKRVNKEVHLTVVFAVYKETERLSFPHESSLGEDCLNEKIRQLEWLASCGPMLTWDLLIVDDGCPDNSAQK